MCAQARSRKYCRLCVASQHSMSVVPVEIYAFIAQEQASISISRIEQKKKKNKHCEGARVRRNVKFSGRPPTVPH